MSHRYDCPTEWEARRQGERAYENGRSSWGNPFRDDGCEEAERAWRSGYGAAERREEERQHERMMERRREEARQEEDYWAQQQAEDDQRANEMEEEYWRAMDAEYAASFQPLPEPPPGTEERDGDAEPSA